MTAFRFLGRLCIDLAEFETLNRPRDLGRWLAESSLAVGVTAVAPDVAAAKRLRRAIWNGAASVVDGGAPAAAELEAINEAAARPPLVPALAGEAREWRDPQPAQALSDIARDAIALFSDPAQRARLRRCESPDCELIFYDSSRPGRRRWCSTERCGDRMRARAYRARHRA